MGRRGGEGGWGDVQFQRTPRADAPDVGLDFVAVGVGVVSILMVREGREARVGRERGGSKDMRGRTYLGP